MTTCPRLLWTASCPSRRATTRATGRTSSSCCPRRTAATLSFDFEWKDQPTVTKSKICLILWSPEYSSVRSKMIYAASQEAVASKMADVQRQLQATELEELEYGVIKNQVAK
eukprot:TRINITY_DN248_c0_g1_i5.p2 TRINITY_DN248_c0_g1~~TRINITY_DN248_c0_g1_i5.p2  ORF type:complete len:112 (-),score=14.12 TRINITY_DN248_c0_g1_i5:99-434(-)